jgi:hypothetical protein
LKIEELDQDACVRLLKSQKAMLLQSLAELDHILQERADKIK